MGLQDFSDCFLKIRWQETDKCYLLKTKDKPSEIHISESIIKHSDYKQCKELKLIRKFIFNDYVQDICKKLTENYEN